MGFLGGITDFMSKIREAAEKMEKVTKVSTAVMGPAGVYAQLQKLSPDKLQAWADSAKLRGLDSKQIDDIVSSIQSQSAATVTHDEAAARNHEVVNSVANQASAGAPDISNDLVVNAATLKALADQAGISKATADQPTQQQFEANLRSVRTGNV